ncbi:MAG: SPOR domain-containing protein [Burkholderiales bacterium]
MARAAPSDEQVQLRRRARRRLIGAIALVTVVAVVLPWVLEHEPRPSEEEIAIQIPSPDAGSFDARPAGKDSAPNRAGTGEPAGAGRDDALRAEQDRVLAPPEKPSARDKPETAATEPKKKAADSHQSAAAKQSFVVQIAALADADKARDIQQALAAKGLEAYTEKIKSANGDMTRVRVGPFPSREAAEKERTRLQALGFEGNVTPR